MSRACRHPLRQVPHNPTWLTCDIHRADFPHLENCLGHGTQGCTTLCANGTPTDEQLLGMAVELLGKGHTAHGVDTPCGAVPRDLARALAPLINQADGGRGLPEVLRADLVAVARVLIGRNA
ncbi:hypothetical protein [Streptomyces sp. NBC_01314]|uniref:hypothetical protein n=1 Tax=Streptomyces sp. NBC_01314 TaxID=2903821 RepID=UPI00308F79A5|nr:hypothetical protein OG622_28445 [Streptomyces sp. NBC_01314]